MTVRIGLLGSGFVSNFYMLGLRDVSGWEIPVVASANGDHARRFAEKWHIVDATADVGGVIARTDLDLIILGVPNHLHMDLALQCARAGKHVVCTKPLGAIAGKRKRCSMRSRRPASFTDTPRQRSSVRR